MTQPIDGRLDAILRLPQVQRITGLSRSSIYALQGARQFPHSIQLSPRAVGWLESEIRSWLLSRAGKRPGAPMDEPGPAAELRVPRNSL